MDNRVGRCLLDDGKFEELAKHNQQRQYASEEVKTPSLENTI